MTRSSHRARLGSGNQWVQTLAVVVVLALVAVVFAVVRFSGAEAITAEPTVESTQGVRAQLTPPRTTPSKSSASLVVTAAAPRAISARELDRKVAARRAALRDRAQEAAQLARDVRRRQLLARAARDARRRERVASAPFDVRVGTFNVLGSQHTAPGGERRNFPPASVRSPAQAAYINEHGLEIVGMQELQDDQLNVISSRTGLTAYPGFAWGSKETDNSILYDAGRFEMVSGDVFTIPFMGRPRPQPILRLRVRETGREFYVVNTHPSAGHYGRYAAERRYGQDVTVGVLNGLKSAGLPILLTGDMNDRAPFYDRVVCRGGLVSASGGSGCASRPPQMYAVDWVVGTPSVSFGDYVSDGGPQARRLTDHYVVHATAHVG